VLTLLYLLTPKTICCLLASSYHDLLVGAESNILLFVSVARYHENLISRWNFAVTVLHISNVRICPSVPHCFKNEPMKDGVEQDLELNELW